MKSSGRSFLGVILPPLDNEPLHHLARFPGPVEAVHPILKGRRRLSTFYSRACCGQNRPGFRLHAAPRLRRPHSETPVNLFRQIPNVKNGRKNPPLAFLFFAYIKAIVGIDVNSRFKPPILPGFYGFPSSWPTLVLGIGPGISRQNTVYLPIG